MNDKDKLAALLKELQELREKSKAGTLTDDEGSAFDTKVIEARDLKAKIDATERRQADAGALDDMDTFLNKGTGSAARTVTSDMRAEARTNSGKSKIDIRSAGERFLNSDGFKSWMQRG